MTDPAIARAAFAHRHLAQNHLRHIVARTRAELGLDRNKITANKITAGRITARWEHRPRRDSRGRFVKLADR